MNMTDEILNSWTDADECLADKIEKVGSDVVNLVAKGTTYFPTSDVITIPNNSDLNNYTTIGNYAVHSGSASNTIQNNPATGGGFRLIVANMIAPGNDGKLCYQWIIPNNHNDILCYRRKMEWNGTGFTFSSWYSFGGTVVS